MARRPAVPALLGVLFVIALSADGGHGQLAAQNAAATEQLEQSSENDNEPDASINSSSAAKSTAGSDSDSLDNQAPSGPGIGSSRVHTLYTTFTFINRFVKDDRPVALTTRETISRVTPLSAGQAAPSGTTRRTETFFTTYTYYKTEAAGEGRPRVTSTEEVTTQVVVTEAARLPAIAPRPAAVRPAVLTTLPPQQLPQAPLLPPAVEPSLPTAGERNSVVLAATRTFYTTSTFYTTLAEGGSTVVRSRTELTSRVQTELVTTWLQLAPSAVRPLVSQTVTWLGQSGQQQQGVPVRQEDTESADIQAAGGAVSQGSVQDMATAAGGQASASGTVSEAEKNAVLLAVQAVVAEADEEDAGAGRPSAKPSTFVPDTFIGSVKPEEQAQAASQSQKPLSPDAGIASAGATPTAVITTPSASNPSKPLATQLPPSSKPVAVKVPSPSKPLATQAPPPSKPVPVKVLSPSKPQASKVPPPSKPVPVKVLSPSKPLASQVPPPSKPVAVKIPSPSKPLTAPASPPPSKPLGSPASPPPSRPLAALAPAAVSSPAPASVQTSVQTSTSTSVSETSALSPGLGGLAGGLLGLGGLAAGLIRNVIPLPLPLRRDGNSGVPAFRRPPPGTRPGIRLGARPGVRPEARPPGANRRNEGSANRHDNGYFVVMGPDGQVIRLNRAPGGAHPPPTRRTGLHGGPPTQGGAPNAVQAPSQRRPGFHGVPPPPRGVAPVRRQDRPRRPKPVSRPLTRIPSRIDGPARAGPPPPRRSGRPGRPGRLPGRPHGRPVGPNHLHRPNRPISRRPRPRPTGYIAVRPGDQQQQHQQLPPPTPTSGFQQQPGQFSHPSHRGSRVPEPQRHQPSPESAHRQHPPAADTRPPPPQHAGVARSPPPQHGGVTRPAIPQYPEVVRPPTPQQSGVANPPPSQHAVIGGPSPSHHAKVRQPTPQQAGVVRPQPPPHVHVNGIHNNEISPNARPHTTGHGFTQAHPNQGAAPETNPSLSKPQTLYREHLVKSPQLQTGALVFKTEIDGPPVAPGNTKVTSELPSYYELNNSVDQEPSDDQKPAASVFTNFGPDGTPVDDSRDEVVRVITTPTGSRNPSQETPAVQASPILVPTLHTIASVEGPNRIVGTNVFKQVVALSTLQKQESAAVAPSPVTNIQTTRTVDEYIAPPPAAGVPAAVSHEGSAPLEFGDPVTSTGESQSSGPGYDSAVGAGLEGLALPGFSGPGSSTGPSESSGPGYDTAANANPKEFETSGSRIPATSTGVLQGSAPSYDAGGGLGSELSETPGSSDRLPENFITSFGQKISDQEIGSAHAQESPGLGHSPQSPEISKESGVSSKWEESGYSEIGEDRYVRPENDDTGNDIQVPGHNPFIDPLKTSHGSNTPGLSDASFNEQSPAVSPAGISSPPDGSYGSKEHNRQSATEYGEEPNRSPAIGYDYSAPEYEAATEQPDRQQYGDRNDYFTSPGTAPSGPSTEDDELRAPDSVLNQKEPPHNANLEPTSEEGVSDATQDPAREPGRLGEAGSSSSTDAQAGTVGNSVRGDGQAEQNGGSTWTDGHGGKTGESAREGGQVEKTGESVRTDGQVGDTAGPASNNGQTGESGDLSYTDGQTAETGDSALKNEQAGETGDSVWTGGHSEDNEDSRWTNEQAQVGDFASGSPLSYGEAPPSAPGLQKESDEGAYVSGSEVDSGGRLSVFGSRQNSEDTPFTSDDLFEAEENGASPFETHSIQELNGITERISSSGSQPKAQEVPDKPYISKPTRKPFRGIVRPSWAEYHDEEGDSQVRPLQTSGNSRFGSETGQSSPSSDWSNESGSPQSHDETSQPPANDTEYVTPAEGEPNVADTYETDSAQSDLSSPGADTQVSEDLDLDLDQSVKEQWVQTGDDGENADSAVGDQRRPSGVSLASSLEQASSAASASGSRTPGLNTLRQPGRRKPGRRPSLADIIRQTLRASRSSLVTVELSSSRSRVHISSATITPSRTRTRLGVVTSATTTHHRVSPGRRPPGIRRPAWAQEQAGKAGDSASSHDDYETGNSASAGEQSVGTDDPSWDFGQPKETGDSGWSYGQDFETGSSGTAYGQDYETGASAPTYDQDYYETGTSGSTGEGTAHDGRSESTDGQTTGANNQMKETGGQSGETGDQSGQETQLVETGQSANTEEQTVGGEQPEMADEDEAEQPEKTDQQSSQLEEQVHDDNRNTSEVNKGTKHSNDFAEGAHEATDQQSDAETASPVADTAGPDSGSERPVEVVVGVSTAGVRANVSEITTTEKSRPITSTEKTTATMPEETSEDARIPAGNSDKTTVAPSTGTPARDPAAPSVGDPGRATESSSTDKPGGETVAPSGGGPGHGSVVIAGLLLPTQQEGELSRDAVRPGLEQPLLSEDKQQEDGCPRPCQAAINEVCRQMAGEHRCLCRPGFSRARSSDACEPALTYQVRLLLDRVNDIPLQYRAPFGEPSSAEYQQLAGLAEQGLQESLGSRGPLASRLHGTTLMEFKRAADLPGAAPTRPQALMADIMVQITDRESKSFDKDSLQEIVEDSLRDTNYSLSDRQVMVSPLHGDVTVLDFDECQSDEYNDCHEHAFCYNLAGTFTCSCRDGLVDTGVPSLPGRSCSGEYSGCPECSYSGECYTQPSGEPGCRCHRWYAGQRCQVNLRVLLIALASAGALLALLLCVCCYFCCRRRGRRMAAPPLVFSGPGGFLRPRGSRLHHPVADQRAMLDSSSETSIPATSRRHTPAGGKRLVPPLSAAQKSSGPGSRSSQQQPPDTARPSRFLPRPRHKPEVPSTPRSLNSQTGADPAAAPPGRTQPQLMGLLHPSDGGRGRISGGTFRTGRTSRSSARPESDPQVCPLPGGRSRSSSAGRRPQPESHVSQLPSGRSRSRSSDSVGGAPERAECGTHNFFRARTMSDARSFDEDLIEPSVRPIARFDTQRSHRSSHAPSSHGYTYEHHTMAERDAASTYVMPETHLFRRAQDSDAQSETSLVEDFPRMDAASSVSSRRGYR